MTLQAYITPAPRPIDGDIFIRPCDSPSWDYTIRLGDAGHIFINHDDLDNLILVLTTLLYDHDQISMKTAERVAFLCQSVLADSIPRCDICGETEEASLMDWNGETGNHYECEGASKCGSCGGSGQVGAPWDPESCGACRGTGYSDQPVMTKDEYDAYVADVLTEEE